MSKQREILLSQRFFPEFGGSIRLLFEFFRGQKSPVEVICHDYGIKTGQVAVFTGKTPDSLIYTRADILQDNWGLDSAKNFIKALRLSSISYFAAARAPRVFCARIIPEGIPAYISSKLRLKKRSFVAFAHGEEILACQSSRQLSLFLKFIAKRLDLVIANSQHTAKLLSPYVANSKIEVITPGVAIDEYYPLEPEERNSKRAALGVEQDSFLLLTVGRLDSRKNQISVIKSVERLRAEFPGLNYYVVGSGPESKALQREIQARGLQNCVRIFENVSEEQKLNFLQIADLFVMPSVQSTTDTEGFGLAFLEAAACGLPSIAGDVGGQAEAVINETTGLVIDGSNLEQLTEAIAACIKDSDRLASFASAALARARNQDWSVKRAALLAALNTRGL